MITKKIKILVCMKPMLIFVAIGAVAFLVTACTTSKPPLATATLFPSSTPTLMPTATSSSVPTATITPTFDPILTEYHILSDKTWRFRRDPPDGWQEIAFDDSSWSLVSAEEIRVIPVSLALGLWDYPYVYKQDDTLSFRKVFDVQVLPFRARLVVAADDAVDVYLNGNLVYKDSFRNVSYLELEVTQQLRQGKNVLALQGTDLGKGTAYVVADLGLCPAERPDRYPPYIEIKPHWEGEKNDRIWLEAMDPSCDTGVTEIVYRIDGGDWIPMDPHKYFNLPQGTHFMEARATDGSGKQGFDSWTFHVK